MCFITICIRAQPLTSPLHINSSRISHSSRSIASIPPAPVSKLLIGFTMAKLVFGMLLGLAVAIALLAAGANAVTCTTNGGSPTVDDANQCVQYVRNLGSSQCCQQNGDGSCTTMCATGSAAVQVCGGSNQCTQCITAGDALNDVLAQCTRNVGGTARVSGSEDAAGLTFVIGSSNGLGKKNTTAQVIEMVRDE